MLPDRPLAGLTVLVVEDSRFASEALRLLCLRSGARIRRADSLRAALKHLRTYRPTVLIVDMGLPDGNGAELIRSLTANMPRPAVVLGISGDPANEAAALAAGADGFLCKPIERVAQFQQAILAALPGDLNRGGMRLLPDDMIWPDQTALRDDLSHVAEILATATDTAAIDYIARFLAGIARSAHDPQLEEAARTLARDQREGRAMAADLARISGLVHDRLDAVGQI
nr:response regulator [Paracoccus aminophilus]